MDNGEVLLKVEDLCQYFKIGPGNELKAVDHVSFDIKKGEVFGLVGESGCGKTTTGRSIIRLYDITSGSVYFKGQRICAGVRSYKDAIKQACLDYETKAAPYKGKQDEESLQAIARLKAERDEILLDQKAKMQAARYDHKNCNKLYAQEHIKNKKI